MNNKYGLYSEDIPRFIKEYGIYTLLDLTLFSKRLKELGLINLVEDKDKDRLYSRGSQILERGKKRIIFPIGFKEIDNLLNGGVYTGMITDFYGGSGVGKTQICFQLCANTAEYFKKNNLNGLIIFVDTVGTFRPERIVEIAKARDFCSEECLNKIKIVNVRSVLDQLALKNKFENLAHNFNVKLIIIDNLTNNFLCEYQNENQLIKRQSGLAKHLHDLALIALKHDLAIVVTNNVRERIERLQEEECGGNVIIQTIHKRVYLKREGDKWVASIHGRKAYFKISNKGIVNIDED
ncbi:MAG: ATPase domain-containing protein [Nitrososphaerales archaeon]